MSRIVIESELQAGLITVFHGTDEESTIIAVEELEHAIELNKKKFAPSPPKNCRCRKKQEAKSNLSQEQKEFLDDMASIPFAPLLLIMFLAKDLYKDINGKQGSNSIF